MRSVSHLVLIGAAAVVCTFFAKPASAYVDIELNNHQHVLADSYRAEGNKLIVYRPSGGMEIDRATIKSIQERDGELPREAPRAATAEEPAATDASPQPAAAAPRAAPSDPRHRDNELSRRLIYIYGDRLAAKNRGDKQEVERLEKEAKPLERERAALQKALESKNSAPE